MVAPKLRFQEFDGDWESKKLKDLTDILKCGVASTPKYVTEGGYPFLSAQNISRNGEMNYSKVNNISDDFYKKISKTKLLKGDILYSRVGASYGVAAIFDREEEYGVYVSLTHIRVNDTLNNIFLKQFLNSPKARIQAEQGVFQGGGVQNLNVGVVEEFNLTLPSKQEQTKIASFLSSVDEKISQLTQKHQLLSQYKQGMMQKLFSQQIRFKADDGSEYGEWGTAKIGNIAETIFGYPFDSKEMVEDNNGVPLMRGINIGERHIRHTPELDRFFMKNISKLEKYIVKENDIVLSMDGSKVGRNAALVSQKDANSLLVQRVCILRENTFSNIKYIYQWIISNHFHKYVDQVKTSSGIPHISGKQIQEYEIHYPCLEEQTKIANFLSAIDQKIDVVSEQLEQAKLWKKGLLQQMFV